MVIYLINHQCQFSCRHCSQCTACAWRNCLPNYIVLISFHGPISIVTVNTTVLLLVWMVLQASFLLFRPQKKKKWKTFGHLTDDNILDCMAELPVTKLVTQYCKDLCVVAPLFLVLSQKIVKTECCCI